MDMNPWLLLLVFFALFFIVFSIAMLYRKNRGYRDYDERQRMVRGKAYQAAFWILVAYSSINAFLDSVGGIQWADMITGTFLGILLAATVFGMINIINDSFYTFKERPGSYFIVLLIALVVNLLITISHFAEGTSFVTNGMLNYHCMNLFIVIAVIPLVVTLFIKYCNDKKHIETE